MKTFNVISLYILGFFFFSNLSAQNCDPNLFTQAPTGLDAIANFSNSTITLSWDPYPNATACMVLGKKAGEPSDFPFIVGDVNTLDSPSEFTFSINWLEFNVDYSWKVICGCSINPVITSPPSATDNFEINFIDP